MNRESSLRQQRMARQLKHARLSAAAVEREQEERLLSDAERRNRQRADRERRRQEHEARNRAAVLLEQAKMQRPVEDKMLRGPIAAKGVQVVRPEDDGGDSLDGVVFASPQAQLLAESAGLTADHLKRHKCSSRGYTAAEVRGILQYRLDHPDAEPDEEED